MALPDTSPSPRGCTRDSTEERGWDRVLESSGSPRLHGMTLDGATGGRGLLGESRSWRPTVRHHLGPESGPGFSTHLRVPGPSRSTPPYGSGKGKREEGVPSWTEITDDRTQCTSQEIWIRVHPPPVRGTRVSFLSLVWWDKREVTDSEGRGQDRQRGSPGRVGYWRVLARVETGSHTPTTCEWNVTRTGVG